MSAMSLKNRYLWNDTPRWNVIWKGIFEKDLSVHVNSFWQLLEEQIIQLSG